MLTTSAAPGAVVRRQATHVGKPRWIWALLLALLLAQSLGLVHRVMHADRGLPAASDHTLPLAADAGSGLRSLAAAELQDDGWLHRLFCDDGHADVCALYDQMGHADGLANLPIPWLPPVWVAAVPSWHASWLLAAQAVGFLARGPPQPG